MDGSQEGNNDSAVADLNGLEQVKIVSRLLVADHEVVQEL